MNARSPASADQMLILVSKLPDQLASSSQLPGLDLLESLPNAPQRVLLCGMGGSAIAGDLIQPLLASAKFSFTVHRDYGLPAWAVQDTLVIASSYSGNTEETLSAVQEAANRGCTILALTSGGRLREMGRDGIGTVAGFPVVELPSGLPPRASLGYGLGVLLWSLFRFGLILSPEQGVSQSVAELQNGNDSWLVNTSEENNVCLALARRCLNRFPVIYTTSPEAHGAGMRLKAQLNENAKCPAYCIAFPELNHNDIVGWSLDRDRRHNFVLLILRSHDEDERTAQRVSITKELLSSEFHTVQEIWSRGSCPLARVFSLVQFGDYLSCYLALATGVDPVPVERIDVLKERLQKGSDA